MFRSAGATNGRPLIARNAGNRLIWGIGSIIKPILFNTEMVRAILDGRKTVTRRVVKPQPRAIYHNGKVYDDDGMYVVAENQNGGVEQIEPPYRPGDILYVRETWTQDGDVFRYKAGFYDQNRRWHPSIHMPREAARIFLRVTEVRVERLHEITEEQARAEGVKGWMAATDRDWDKNPNHLLAFRHAWNSTLKKSDRALYGWEANPWVWVIEFERISREEAEHD